MDFYVCVYVPAEANRREAHTQQEGGCCQLSIQAGHRGNEDKVPPWHIHDSLCMCTCKRQTSRSPVVVSQSWIPGPSDTSSCLDIRPPEDTHSWGWDKAASTHTHTTALPIRSCISVLLVTFSYSCVTSSPWSHEGSHSSCEEHTEEHLCTRTGVLISMHVCMDACCCQFCRSQTSFFWHHLVISEKLQDPQNVFDRKKSKSV